jgi:hypothetical protein
MHYILCKYAEVYGNNDRVYDDPNLAMAEFDPDSKIRMTDDMMKPLNPFKTIHEFDQSLMLSRYHFRQGGHNGRFLVTHALPAIGAIIEFQHSRNSRLKARSWIPGNGGRDSHVLAFWRHV